MPDRPRALVLDTEVLFRFQEGSLYDPLASYAKTSNIHLLVPEAVYSEHRFKCESEPKFNAKAEKTKRQLREGVLSLLTQNLIEGGKLELGTPSQISELFQSYEDQYSFLTERIMHKGEAACYAAAIVFPGFVACSTDSAAKRTAANEKCVLPPSIDAYDLMVVMSINGHLDDNLGQEAIKYIGKCGMYVPPLFKNRKFKDGVADHSKNSLHHCGLL